MDDTSPRLPKRRQAGLLAEKAGDETIVYDEDRREAHSLNRTAALVWHHCDGNHSASELAAVVANELGGTVDETIVAYALDHLAQAHLIEEDASAGEPRVTRRDVMRKLAVAGAVIAIPTVMSVLAPTPAMAASTTEPPPDPGPDG